MARGEAVEALEAWPAGTMLLCLVEDVIRLGIKLLDLLFYKARARLDGHACDPMNAPLSLKELMRSYLESYLRSDRKFYNLYFSHFFSDPMVSITWWLQTMSAVWRALKEIGR